MMPYWYSVTMRCLVAIGIVAVVIISHMIIHL